MLKKLANRISHPLNEHLEQTQAESISQRWMSVYRSGSALSVGGPDLMSKRFK